MPANPDARVLSSKNAVATGNGDSDEKLLAKNREQAQKARQPIKIASFRC